MMLKQEYLSKKPASSLGTLPLLSTLIRSNMISVSAASAQNSGNTFKSSGSTTTNNTDAKDVTTVTTTNRNDMDTLEQIQHRQETVKKLQNLSIDDSALSIDTTADITRSSTGKTPEEDTKVHAKNDMVSASGGSSTPLTEGQQPLQTAPMGSSNNNPVSFRTGTVIDDPASVNPSHYHKASSVLSGSTLAQRENMIEQHIDASSDPKFMNLVGVDTPTPLGSNGVETPLRQETYGGVGGGSSINVDYLPTDKNGFIEVGDNVPNLRLNFPNANKQQSNRYSFLSSTSTECDFLFEQRRGTSSLFSVAQSRQQQLQPQSQSQSQHQRQEQEEQQKLFRSAAQEIESAKLDLKIKQLELEIKELRLQNEQLLNSINNNRLMEDKLMLELLHQKQTQLSNLNEQAAGILQPPVLASPTKRGAGNTTLSDQKRYRHHRHPYGLSNSSMYKYGLNDDDDDDDNDSVEASKYSQQREEYNMKRESIEEKLRNLERQFEFYQTALKRLSSDERAKLHKSNSSRSPDRANSQSSPPKIRLRNKKRRGRKSFRISRFSGAELQKIEDQSELSSSTFLSSSPSSSSLSGSDADEEVGSEDECRDSVTASNGSPQSVRTDRARDYEVGNEKAVINDNESHCSSNGSLKRGLQLHLQIQRQ